MAGAQLRRTARRGCGASKRAPWPRNTSATRKRSPLWRSRTERHSGEENKNENETTKNQQTKTTEDRRPVLTNSFLFLVHALSMVPPPPPDCCVIHELLPSSLSTTRNDSIWIFQTGFMAVAICRQSLDNFSYRFYCESLRFGSSGLRQFKTPILSRFQPSTISKHGSTKHFFGCYYSW